VPPSPALLPGPHAALGFLTQDGGAELIQISDMNWFEKFGILKGGEEGFCAGLPPLQGNKDAGLHRDLDHQGLQYRLNWLIGLLNLFLSCPATGRGVGLGRAAARCTAPKLPRAESQSRELVVIFGRSLAGFVFARPTSPAGRSQTFFSSEKEKWGLISNLDGAAPLPKLPRVFRVGPNPGGEKGVPEIR